MEKLRKVGFSKLTSFEDAWKILDRYVKITPTQEVEVNHALNRILAINIESSLDIPPFERSAMDGYAINAEDSFGASSKNPKKVNLIGKIEIGQSSQLELHQGEAIRISTGAVMPKGADAVIKIEDTERDKDIITLYSALVPGKNVSKKGEDILKGSIVQRAGIELKPQHIALLSALGYEKIHVKTQPKVSVFATGDELIEVGNPLEPNKIYNSNTPMISNLVRIYGGLVVRESTLKDNKNLIQENLKKASLDSQIIIFTGGTSVGTKDYLPEIIAVSGTILVHGIAMRPGSPILIGITNHTNQCIIFCLPGTPVAAYIGFLTFVGPAIRKLMGSVLADPRMEINAILDKDVPVSSMGYINHLRVKIEKSGEDFKAIPVKLKGSGVLSSLTEANGIIEIPAFQEGFKKGTKVVVKLFPN